MLRRLRSWIRFGYFPFMFCGVNGAALWILFSDARPTTIAMAIAGVMGCALLASFGAERILPYESTWNRDRGDLARDVAHFFANEGFGLGALLLLPVFATRAVDVPSSDWPSDWPLAFQLLVSLVVFDLGQNLFHWTAHLWQPLWRLHAVHHAVDRMYGLNGVVKHPLYQILAGSVSMAPLVAWGIPHALAVALAFMAFTQLLIQHTNVDLCTGGLRRVFATAEVHRFHHLRGRAGDVNFALFFSCLDHLFGNAYFADRRLQSEDIGLDSVGYPVDWAAQMLAPFRKFAPEPAEMKEPQ